MLIYVGAYTPEGGGVRCFQQDPHSGALTETHSPAPASDPSFLAWGQDGAYLYAVGETAGGLASFARAEDGLLTPLNQEWTGGSSPCHLAVDPTGRFVVTANYGDGTVSVHPVEADGSLGPRRDLVAHAGKGPDPERQEGPHAHQIAYLPGGDTFLVTDLGTDTVHEYTLSPDGAVQPLRAFPAEAGSGPRHVAFHPAGLVFVAGELDSSVMIYRRTADGLERVGRVAATAQEPPVRNYPSHIECSSDGRFVYVGNRGANAITVLAVHGDELRPVADVPSGGEWPRHFAIAGDFLYVANQDSGTVAALPLDPATGVPGEARVVAEVTQASCILPSPA
ncbi:MAG: lactonase family protein [Hamadaea sp.]|nr:lactonase family protein [Hamadaea sp.]